MITKNHLKHRLHPLNSTKILSTLLACSLFLPIGYSSTVFAQEEDSVPEAKVSVPEAMVTRNIPVLSESLKAQVEQYSHVRSAAFVDWYPTPQGKSTSGLLMTTRFGNTYQFHRLMQPGARREQLTFFEEPVSSGHFSPTQPQWFLFGKDIGGSENYQLFLLNTLTGKSEMISDGKSRHGGALWAPDGKHFAFNSTRRNGKDNDIYLSTIADPKTAKRVYTGEGYWTAADWSPDGQSLLLYNYISAQKSQYRQVHLPTGKVTEVFPEKNGNVSFGDGLFAKDGKGIYYTSDEKGDFKQLYYKAFDKPDSEALTPKLQWDISDLAMSHDGQHIAMVHNEDGIAQLRLLNTKTRQLSKLTGIPIGQISRISFSPDDQQLAMTLSTSKAPADVYTLKLQAFPKQSPELVRWTYSEVGGLDSSGFAEAQLIHYPSFDGKSIPAFYYHPPHLKGKKVPVVIQIHGGPEGQYRPAFSSRLHYWLNELGIAVIAPNVRGSSGYGKEFLSLDNGYLREDSVKDIGALLDWIKTQPQLNNERVGVYGGSYGGYMVLASLIHYGDRLKAGVDSVGISNFVTFLNNTKDYRRDLRRVEYGDERDPKMRAFLEKISPTTRAKEIRSPLLVVQGLNDPRVPASEAEQIAAAVSAQGTPLWFLMAKDEGHGFSKKPNRDYLEYVVAQFWKTHLLD